MNATLLNITGAADVSNFTNQLTALNDRITVNTSNSSDLGIRFDAFTQVVNTSFASTVSQASASLITTLNASLSLLNASISSTNALVNTSFTTLATSVSQVNTSVNNVSFNLNQLSNRIDTQNTVKLVCNDISCNQIFCTQVFTTSDLNKKNNIVSCDLGMDFMDTLRPVSFTYTDNPDKVFYGFVAQEVKAALELDDKVPERYGLWTEEQDTQFLSLQELISPLVKSLQEVHARLRQVEAQLVER
jgi:hypothetical protein